MNKLNDLDTLYFKALDLQDKGAFAEAFILLMKGSSLGDAGAQHAVGLAYDQCLGVEQDKREAIRWFKKALRTGKQTFECVAIALTYIELGQRRRAIYWWRKAVELGDGSGALSFAKFLIKANRGKFDSQIINLLKIAANSQESWQISLDEKEEAEKLLKKFSRK